ncbi:MAG: 23S rRNA (adenine(2503)-C(2))-methyltransferase RlmN [Clostridiales bacterium]|nr:23S rRNA (adenine(2503)-C(2))-methyltransferase RlmN [Clostridiales bacterium]MBE6046655.1 23S rRNA (adenine(2503)-C(2))-methyltransferase RlmN [Clostridiales bacterium]
MKNLLGMTMEELKLFVVEIGEKPFRGKQIYNWLNQGARSFDEMTDLSKALREKLKAEAQIGGCRAIRMQEDKSDGTCKILFEAETAAEGSAAAETGAAASGKPADTFEGVFMRYSYGNSLCVSSQVGCKMGCKFCASALGGFVRNLDAGEMLGQVLEAERVTSGAGAADGRDAADGSREKVSRIVIMGMGEPFDNYENVAKFLRLLHAEEGRNMSWRNMTVSTSGLIPGIRRFAEDFPQVNLAISLHRLTDEGRSRIMPVNRKYPLDQLLEAARDYTDKTHRRITFEYALIEGENDTDKDVELMIKRLGGMLCHVNLIPLNKVDETGFNGTSRKRAHEIAERLENAGIPATVRRQLGSEIDGACGQLRLRQQAAEDLADRRKSAE